MSYVRTKLPNKAELQIKWSDFITIFHKIHSFRMVFGQVRSRYDAIYALDGRPISSNRYVFDICVIIDSCFDSMKASCH